MVIDFHTHVFPDKIAERTISALQSASSSTPHTNGTVLGLVESMEKHGISVSVSLPVLTKPEQFESVLNYQVSINEQFKNSTPKIISFAGVHPSCDNLENKMERIKNAGIKGVKIHPEYQRTPIDDEGYIKILTLAKKLDLIVITHAGVDGAFRDTPLMCPPEKLKKVIEKVGHKKFVLAHLGGCELQQEVLDKLCGLNVYFDTAYVLSRYNKNEVKAIINKHGYKKILFASDSPWSNVYSDVQVIKSLGLEKEQENAIFYKNALSLLGIN